MAKSPFDKLHDMHMNANAGIQLTPQGSGGYDMDHNLVPQSAAQRAAVMKAAAASALKRKGKPRMPTIGTKAKIGF